MKKLNLKLKVDLKKQIEDQGSKKRADDPRLLNYYDMKIDENMRVLFVPDVNGELWKHFRKHGPNTGIRAAGDIRCLNDIPGHTCPICERGFALYAKAKKINSKEEQEAVRAEAKRWMPKEYTMMSAIVLESPIEIRQDDKRNEVKLFMAPYSIEDHIKKALQDGDIAQDEVCSTAFVIKKRENQGGRGDYKHSKFERSSLSNSDWDAIEDMNVIQYDYEALDDIIPPAPTQEEAEEWAVRLGELIAKEEDASVAGGSKETQRESVSSRVSERLSRRSSEDEEDAPTPRRTVTRPAADEDEAEEDEAEEADAPRSVRSVREEPREEHTSRPSLRDRLGSR